MNYLKPLFYSLPLLAVSIPSTLAQSPALGVNGTPPIVVASSKPTPASKNNSNAVLESERQALARAGSKVVGEIQTNESDLYHRLQYFEKPARLDPTSFATVQEVKDWQKLLAELKSKSDLVIKLYNTVPENLEAAITNEKIDPQLGRRFKNQIIAGFPWDTIKKKNQLLQEYVAEHSKLLDFYEKNWGSWSKSTGEQKTQFKSPQLTATYTKLCTQIQTTGKSLQTEYSLISTH